MSWVEPEIPPEAECEAPFRPEWPVNRLLTGDCLERLAEIPRKSVHLVLCDLPYGTTRNKWDSLIDLPALWKHYRRILAPRGVVVLTGQGPFTARLMLSNEAWFRYKLVWVKSKSTNFLNVRRQPLRRHEDICVFYKSNPIYQPLMQPGAAYDKGVRKSQLTGSYGDFSSVHVRTDGGRHPTDVLYFKTAENEGPVWHPTQKPINLGRYFVRTHTQPGQVVLDNAFGSGSFLVAALLEGRNFIGIERNDDERQFTTDPVDLVGLAHRRLEAAWEALPAQQRGWLASAPAREPTTR